MGLSIARDLRCLASRGRALAGWRAAESCMLVASWLLLVALSRAKLAGVDAPPVVRVTALGAVLWSAWLLPGWLLWRLATRHTREPWIVAAPAAAVLGLFWLLLPAAAVLLARGSLREMTAAVSAM